MLCLIPFLPFSLFLCRNPMCRTVTVRWLASYRTRWAGTAVPPCLSVALPPATMIQRPNPPWCLANGNVLPCQIAMNLWSTAHICVSLSCSHWNTLAEMCTPEIHVCCSHITASNFAFDKVASEVGFCVAVWILMCKFFPPHLISKLHSCTQIWLSYNLLSTQRNPQNRNISKKASLWTSSRFPLPMNWDWHKSAGSNK